MLQNSKFCKKDDEKFNCKRKLSKSSTENFITKTSEDTSLEKPSFSKFWR